MTCALTSDLCSESVLFETWQGQTRVTCQYLHYNGLVFYLFFLLE